MRRNACPSEPVAGSRQFSRGVRLSKLRRQGALRVHSSARRATSRAFPVSISVEVQKNARGDGWDPAPYGAAAGPAAGAAGGTQSLSQ
jgi:hypothetical protein